MHARAAVEHKLREEQRRQTGTRNSNGEQAEPHPGLHNHQSPHGDPPGLQQRCSLISLAPTRTATTFPIFLNERPRIRLLQTFSPMEPASFIGTWNYRDVTTTHPDLWLERAGHIIYRASSLILP